MYNKATELNTSIRRSIEQLANETDAARQSQLFRDYLRTSAASLLKNRGNLGLSVRRLVSGLLEAVRLCIIVMFGTAKRQFEKGENGIASSLDYVTCASHLNAAYQRMDAPCFKRNQQRDLGIEGAKLASYFSAISGQWATSASHFVNDKALKEFLGRPLDDMIGQVETKYMDFATWISEPPPHTRVEAYKNCLGEVRKQMVQWKRGSGVTENSNS